MVLHGPNTITLLNTPEEKVDLLRETGIDTLIIHPFDERFSKLSAEDFVSDILVGKLKVKKIIIGHDHRFGVNRTAGIDDLITYGKKFSFDVEQIPVQEINDVSVSSTKIRDAITEGNIALANSYLGYEYFLTGTIIKGKQLGRTIGFPTANLAIAEEYKLIPKQGVYVVMSLLGDAMVYGMMNIGTNPTVGGTKLSIEINYFDMDADLYGTTMRVCIIDRIRDEQKFASVELLKEQLVEDREIAISIIREKLNPDAS